MSKTLDIAAQVKLAVARAAAVACRVGLARQRRGYHSGPGRRTLYTDWKEVQKHRKPMTVKPHPRVQAQFPEYLKRLDAHTEKELA